MPHPAVYVVTFVAAVATAIFTYYQFRPSIDEAAPRYYNPDSRSRSRRGGIRNDSRREKDADGFQFIDLSTACSICLEDFNSNITYVSCGHGFHHSCITKWFNTPSSENRCPKCKKVTKII